jgi:hypothetical protein
MFLRDILKLGDLQLRLLLLDIHSAGKGLRTGLTLAIVSATILLGTFPVILLGIAVALRAQFGLRDEIALLLVGAMGVMLGLILLAIAARKLISASTPMKRSQQEFSANLRWIRSVLYREP